MRYLQEGETVSNLRNGDHISLHYRTRAMVGIHGCDGYSVLPPQIKLSRGAKGNRPLKCFVQARQTDSSR